jgi:acetoin utilization deacetylase AcuC-like enzyme
VSGVRERLTTPIVYSRHYGIDLGLHVFPTVKYRLIRDELERRQHELPAFEFVEPVPAGWDQLALVHSDEYLDRLRTGSLTGEEEAQLELPWSQQMVDGFRLMAGGSILAAHLACRTLPDFSLAIHIGGGLHHAFPNHGEGFCPVNDVAVAVRVMQAQGVQRHAIVDLDVHHGNGTAFIFADDERVFTCSMHQQHNYPMWKPRGSLDIGLPDGAHDATYLRELERALPLVFAHRPDCVYYLSGADPYEDDQLGGLRLSKQGLRTRDRLVIEAVRDARLPLVITMAGGYARHVEDTVSIHVATIGEALRAAGPYNSVSA